MGCSSGVFRGWALSPSTASDGWADRFDCPERFRCSVASDTLSRPTSQTEACFSEEHLLSAQSLLSGVDLRSAEPADARFAGVSNP